jgi:hypothetical protein
VRRGSSLTDGDWQDEDESPGPGVAGAAGKSDHEWSDYRGYRMFRGLIAFATLGTVLGLIAMLFYLAF